MEWLMVQRMGPMRQGEPKARLGSPCGEVDCRSARGRMQGRPELGRGRRRGNDCSMASVQQVAT